MRKAFKIFILTLALWQALFNPVNPSLVYAQDDSPTDIPTDVPVDTPTPTPIAICTNVPSAPVLNSAVSNSDNNATLSWTDSPDPVSNYLVSYGTTSGKYVYGDPNIGGQGTTSFTIGSLAGGKEYYFVVAANNDCGISTFSNEVSVIANPVPATPTPTLEPTVTPEVLSAASDLSTPTNTPMEIAGPPTPESASRSSNSTFENLAIIFLVSGFSIIGLVTVIQKGRRKKNSNVPPVGGGIS